MATGQSQRPCSITNGHVPAAAFASHNSTDDSSSPPCLALLAQSGLWDGVKENDARAPREQHLLLQPAAAACHPPTATTNAGFGYKGASLLVCVCVGGGGSG